MSLLDSTMALMTFAAQSYFLDGKNLLRVGNGHPNIVPYGAFKAQDGFVIIAIGTQSQFEKFCRFVEREDLLSHAHYLTNETRVKHREEVIAEMNQIIGQKPVTYWIENLEKIGVPSGPVNTLGEAFQDPQVEVRGIEQTVEGAKTVASPLGLSASPPVYFRRPPHLGEHTDEILKGIFSKNMIEDLKNKGIV